MGRGVAAHHSRMSCARDTSERSRHELMYDNLLANVPTDLWIGGKWRKASDGARFDVIDPATENRSPRSRAPPSRTPRRRSMPRAPRFPAWAAKKPRERGEILRKAFELIMRDAERLAKLITIENGKALSDSRGEVAYAAEFFRWNAEEAVRNLGQLYDRAVVRRAHPGAAQAGRHRGAGDAVEFPRRDGDAQDRPGARRRLHGGAQARLRHAAHHAGADADPGRGRRAGGRRQRHPVALVRQGGERDAARSARARRLLHRLDRGRPQAAARGRRQHRQAGDGARRQRAVHRVRGCRHRCRDRGRDDRQDAQHGRGLHGGEPLLRAREGARRVRQEAHRQDGRAEDGQRPRRRRRARPAGQQGRPRQGGRAGRRRGAARARRC